MQLKLPELKLMLLLKLFITCLIDASKVSMMMVCGTCDNMSSTGARDDSGDLGVQCSRDITGFDITGFAL